MIFRQLFDAASSTYSYLIADPNSLEAIIVDSVIEQSPRDIQLLQELNLKLLYTLETHIHADHITGADQLRKATGCKVLVPANANVTKEDGVIQDGQQINLGSITITAIATPGHTDSHVAYKVNGDRILTSDALLIRGCGRTDFQNGCPEILFDSITQRLFTLPDSILIFPGHDYKGLPYSTIGEEKRCNPRLANKNKNEFTEIMNNLNLPMPKRLHEALPANECCGA